MSALVRLELLAIRVNPLTPVLGIPTNLADYFSPRDKIEIDTLQVRSGGPFQLGALPEKMQPKLQKARVCTGTVLMPTPWG